MADVPQLRLGVRAVAEAVARGLTTPTEVTVAVLDRIRRLEPAVRAWSVVDADGALRQARVLTEEASAGRLRGPLHGVPV
ncbi:MAG TPA: amidase family protein, partial [Rugosimonospora sp.]|nr:amidase family protein [Rugosimonospora sp.]